MPTVIHDITLSDLDEALTHAYTTVTVRRAFSLDTTASEAWIDTLLDMRTALTG